MAEEAARLPGCRRVEHLMGMAISVDVRDAGVSAAALDAVFAWLIHVDETFSTYKDTSEVSRLNRGELTQAECSAEVRGVFDLCERARQETAGFFDVRAGGSGQLDPSGMVKGWAVEQASAILVAHGSLNHFVNAGGDIRMRGRPEPGRPWQVGIVHPFERHALTAVVEGEDLAVATSGTAERGMHVFDPHEGRPATALASVTLVGPELTFTDAYATAALAMGLDAPRWLAGLPDHEAYVIDAHGHVWWTEGFARHAPALAATPPPILTA